MLYPSWFIPWLYKSQELLACLLCWIFTPIVELNKICPDSYTMHNLINQCIKCTCICSCAHTSWWLQCTFCYVSSQAFVIICYPDPWQQQKFMAYLSFMADIYPNTCQIYCSYPAAWKNANSNYLWDIIKVHFKKNKLWIYESFVGKWRA